MPESTTSSYTSFSQCHPERSEAVGSIAVFAHGAFPVEMHHAQKLQKSFRSPKATIPKDHPLG